MRAIKGARYRVLRNSNAYSFKVGEIVVVLEDDSIPYCVRKKDYREGKELIDYEIGEIYAMMIDELELLGGQE